MNQTVIALLAGLVVGAAAGAAGGYLAAPEAREDGTDAERVAELEGQVRRLRAEMDVLERKLARKSASPLETFNLNRGAGGSDAVDGGPALDDAAKTLSDLLRGLESQWNPLWGFVGSEKAMSTFFARVASGPVIEGHRTGLSMRPPDGATIRFPAGRHALDAQTLSRYDPFPREIVIEGAGMDTTLLVMNDDIRPLGQVLHLRIKNATVNTNGGSLLHAGDETFSLRLDKCRIVGFDGGSSGIVRGGRGAIFATDCRFAAGYTSRPAGLGTVTAVDGPLLARFERCTFLGPLAEPISPNERSAQVYANCSFEDMPAHFRPNDESFRASVRVEECRFAYLDERAPAVTRTLSDINDSW